LRVYVETSAAAKLVKDELESAELERYFDTGGAELVSTVLLTTELRRIGWRDNIPTEDIAGVLERCDLYELPATAFTQAGALPGPHLRSLDALHVVGALRLAADAILAYDQRVIAAARTVGLEVLAPGAVEPTPGA
jgi:uncharacterized protein